MLDQISDRIIYLCTLPNGFFGSSGSSWRSLDVDEIAASIASAGHNVQISTIDKILEVELRSFDLVIYTSSDEVGIRTYLKDVMFVVSNICEIIPSYESLLAHENKGFQQLIRQKFGFGNLGGAYHFDLEYCAGKFPLVFKGVSGAGSRNVSLIETDGDLMKVKREKFSVSFYRSLVKFYRRLTLSKSEYDIYAYRHKGFYPYVAQQFIPNLKFDFKVLVFANRFYVLKRSVRKGDFRASGSGDFKFELPDLRLLDYARSVFLILKVPYVSLDIAQIADLSFALIEYQVLNFGPYTLLNSDGYYEHGGEDGNLYQWTYIDKKSSLEDNFGHALTTFIQSQVSS
jgi:hypothetical protein